MIRRWPRDGYAQPTTLDLVEETLLLSLKDSEVIPSCLSENGAVIGETGPSDWRTLSWPENPLWSKLIQQNVKPWRDNLERALLVPWNWIPAEICEAQGCALQPAFH
ncbi:hypothetical protein VTJ49DRAFT_4890 [Mycothermus thermophilus]|uniref:Uncharacterized protein n=1 Tax=Humicola insolens TaxID=85995 RepID=A0ABR3V4F4_HUMIN